MDKVTLLFLIPTFIGISGIITLNILTNISYMKYLIIGIVNYVKQRFKKIQWKKLKNVILIPIL